MKRSRLVVLGFSPLMVLGLASLFLAQGCMSTDQRDSNHSDSEEAIRQNYARRLEGSKQAQAIIEKIEKRLSPIDLVLSDLEKLLTLKEKEQFKERLRALEDLSVIRINRELKILKKKLAKVEKNGNWLIEKEIQWPVDRGSAVCSESRLRFEGRLDRQEKEQHVSLKVEDCMLSEPAQILSASLDSKGELTAEIETGSLERILKSGAEMGRCRIVPGQSSGSGFLTCDPWSEKVANGKFTVQVDRLEIQYVSDSTQIEWRGSVADQSGQSLAQFEISKQANGKINARIHR